MYGVRINEKEFRKSMIYSAKIYLERGTQNIIVLSAKGMKT